ncbi:Isopenicillin N epimerase component 2 [Exophiala dermatitidis]
MVRYIHCSPRAGRSGTKSVCRPVHWLGVYPGTQKHYIPQPYRHRLSSDILTFYCSLILADYGADVVRVDRPVSPFGPPRDTLCRHKRSVIVDLKNAQSRHAFLELVKVADVLIDPYRPGVMSRLGLGPSDLRQINPNLIYAHLHGFRPDGIYGARAGHDINYLAVSGVLGLFGRKGEVPSPPANILGDFAGGGLVCVVGILMALMHRIRQKTTTAGGSGSGSGSGQVVTANMVDGTAYLATFARQQLGHENWDRPRGENLLDGAAPFYEVYATKDDRFVAVGAQEPQFYKALLDGLGLEASKMPPQWERQHWPDTKKLFASLFRGRTMREWREVFDSVDACVTPVLNMDETEQPLKTLVELSESPGLDVRDQDPYPELKKGEGAQDVLREWVPNAVTHGSIEIHPESGFLVAVKPRAKL